ncbi:D-alanine--D-alanine ligase [Oerskovia sp. KBS0722]|uniref:D-alanine--D-alanine ligase family protein n=1 Tax=Oerskovia sp. KBS0722 TaxID=1179673 RepID=UPI00110E8867|nr:D-alanine--D-alanine ligase [Oerskovia sp. KBS0722]QDW63496.1 D-alanine--D-alanine ligase [Oerskovia sp. KBS0722]
MGTAAHGTRTPREVGHAENGHAENGTGARLRVAVIGGGQSCEHDVSLATAASIGDALEARDVDVVRLTIGQDGRWSDTHGQLGDGVGVSLTAAVGILSGCDVAFPAVHGPRGEDGTLAALLDLAGIPYVGSGVRGGALAMDKWATKLVARELGIAVAEGSLVDARSPLPPVRVFPVVVKPVASGSSHGVTVARDEAELRESVTRAGLLDDRVLVEDFVVGREIDVAVLETADGARVVGPPLEVVVATGGVFDTADKYHGDPTFLLPAPLSPAEQTALRDAALALFDALGCRGVARFDFFLSPVHGLVLNEVNTMPGMTATSQVPKMFAALGTQYVDLVEGLVLAAAASAAGPVPTRGLAA